jgi:hypothetical protein
MPVVLSEQAWQDLKRDHDKLRGMVHRLAAAGGMRRHEGGQGPRVTILTGALTSTLSAGSSATVAELILNSSNVRVYSGQTYTVWDLKLNTGESIPVDTVIDFCRMSGGRYKWITAYCAVSDNLPE